VLRRQPGVEVARATERGGQVGVAQDERVEPSRCRGDLIHAREAGRGLDQCLDSQRARPAGARLHAVEQAVDEREVAGALDLRHHH
jgi:hypothetical protein